MPIYEFECASCGKVIELLLNSRELEELEESCPQCGGDLHKIFSTASCSVKEKDGDKPACFHSG
jgi:putative FmdB family regulatory protein